MDCSGNSLLVTSLKTAQPTEVVPKAVPQ